MELVSGPLSSLAYIPISTRAARALLIYRLYQLKMHQIWKVHLKRIFKDLWIQIHSSTRWLNAVRQ